jgi:hypothetical protein
MIKNENYKIFFVSIKNTATIFLFLFFLLAGTNLAWAAMRSSNYSIDSDVIGASGGLSSSANYQANDTLGEPVIGESGSTNYIDKAGFWYMGKAGGLGLTCKQANIYMADYTLGGANDFNVTLVQSSQDCTVTDNTSAAWNLTLEATDMTSSHNTIPNTNVLLKTDGVVSSGDTVTSPTSGITEASNGEYALNSLRTIISGDVTAAGNYENQPTIKLQNLNNLYNESTSGTMTFTVQ